MDLWKAFSNSTILKLDCPWISLNSNHQFFSEMIPDLRRPAAKLMTRSQYLRCPSNECCEISFFVASKCAEAKHHMNCECCTGYSLTLSGIVNCVIKSLNRCLCLYHCSCDCLCLCDYLCHCHCHCHFFCQNSMGALFNPISFAIRISKQFLFLF